MNLLKQLRTHERESRASGYFDDADIVREIADAIEGRPDSEGVYTSTWTAVRLAVRRMTREVFR